MRQGTISILIGVHSPVHSLFVVLAWIIVHKEIPKPWEVVCIFLHDIGHLGLDYLDSYEEKCKHWELGARIAGRLFGEEGYALCAGHDTASGYPESKLYKADKYAWYLCPRWLMVWHCFVEPKLSSNWRADIKAFTEKVKESVESGEYRPTHDLYLERHNGGN